MPVIYGDPDLRDDEYDLRERELEQLKSEIKFEAEKASVDQAEKNHLADMALRAIKKSERDQ